MSAHRVRVVTAPAGAESGLTRASAQCTHGRMSWAQCMRRVTSECLKIALCEAADGLYRQT